MNKVERSRKYWLKYIPNQYRTYEISYYYLGRDINGWVVSWGTSKCVITFGQIRHLKQYYDKNPRYVARVFGAYISHQCISWKEFYTGSRDPWTISADAGNCFYNILMDSKLWQDPAYVWLSCVKTSLPKDIRKIIYYLIKGSNE